MKDATTHAWLRRVSDYHSGGVSAAERAAVEAHLAECVECRQALDVYRRFYTLARSPLRLGDGGAGALTDYRLFTQEEFMPTTSDPNQDVGSTTTLPRRPRAMLTPLGAIAAVVLVALLAGAPLALHNVPSRSANSHSTPTLRAPTATTPAGPTVLYQNTLLAPPSDGSWPDAPQFGCFFGGGGHHVKDAWNCNIPLLGNIQDQTNLVQDTDVTVQVKQIGGLTSGSYGIGLGNPVQSDRFDVESDGKWTFVACQGSHCTTDVGLTASSAIHAGLGATNTLEVRVVNNHFDFFMNATKVGQVDDRNYGNICGHIYLDGTDGIEVMFNNVKIAMAS
jgi:hypothetical protein